MASSLDYSQFHEVFRPDVNAPYDQLLVRDIESKRKKLGGVLFIDRVLRALGITKAKSYPPRTENALHGLHQQICAAKTGPHQKLSVLYYLLLDYDEGLSPRSQLAESFARQAGLPKSYQILIKGLWYMDRLQFQLALEYLTHPPLSPEFADDIIAVLVRHSESHDYSLPLAYFHSVQPVLKTPEALELLFGATARTDVTEAFYFSRKYPDAAREQMFHQLMTSVMGEAGSQDVATRATALVSLPLDELEEAWFHEYLTSGDGRKNKRAKDMLTMRRVVTGHHAEAVSERNLGAHWGTVLQGVKTGAGGRKEL